MAGNAENNTLGSYTVLHKLKGALQAPGRVYAARNAATGHPALLVATRPAEYTPSGPWKLRVEAGIHPRPFVAVEVLSAPHCAHPGRELAEVMDLAAAALESVEALPELQRHLESRPSPWRWLWRTHARVSTPYLGALAGAVVAGLVALLSSTAVRHPVRLPQPEATVQVGVAEEALTEPVAMPVAGMQVRAPTLALDMPKKPFPDQYRVDGEGKCDAETEVAINGGCWVSVKWAPEVCKRRGYEWKGGCYLPSMPSARDPSSNAPRIPPTPAQRAQ
jgi:hypothetical protein